jgi:hypothetical protein
LIYKCINLHRQNVCLQIVEKSPDGWWRGRMQDTEGDFPASFVEEVEIPTTMEEKKQLALHFRKNSPDQLQEDQWL